ncbi:MAG: alkaline phosphatase [Deltaproteobacteria bacterium]|nr:alkaline phosphatase [Deltaproteobacteria bacterium]
MNQFKRQLLIIGSLALLAFAGCDEDGSSGTCTSAQDSNGNVIVACGDDTAMVFSGKDGVNGTNGKDGTNGINGTVGVNGKDGVDGASGKNGADGADGTDGAPGIDGMDGENGAPGQDGLNGHNGICANNTAPTLADVTVDMPRLCIGDVATVTVNATDIDGDALNYSIAGAGGALSQSDSDASIWMYTATTAGGPYALTITVTDGCEVRVASAVIDRVNNCDTWNRKNVILFIGDGMNREHEIAASRYMNGNDASLVFHDFPYHNYVTTWDVDTYNRYAWARSRSAYTPGNFDATVGYDSSIGGVVASPEAITDDGYFLDQLPSPPSANDLTSAATPATDSASAATAMATGLKTEAGNIAWMAGDSQNGRIETIAQWMRNSQNGRFGVVSTVQFNHATPAAFVSHNVNRSNYSDNKNNGTSFAKNIAEEIVEDVQPDVVIGAGWYGAEYVPDALRAELSTSLDYEYVERIEGEDGGANLMAAATDAVNAGTKLFGLFGGETDYMEHPVPGEGGDFSVETENPSLAVATRAALKVLRQDANGFFLMVEGGDIDWANHANNYHWMIGAMHQFEDSVKEVIDTVDAADDDMDWSNTLVVVTSDHSNSYMRLNDSVVLGQGELPVMEGVDNAHTYPGGEVSYGSTGHTNELVTVAARGAGAELFENYDDNWYGDDKNIVDNTHIYNVMREAVETGVAKHVILLIGDGMNIAHEVAASRYLYGTDDGLSWRNAAFTFQGWSTTWDVDTYNRFAYAAHMPPYHTDAVNVSVGYDAATYGFAPKVNEEDTTDAMDAYFLDGIKGYKYGLPTAQPATDSASASTAMATGKKTDSGNIAFAMEDPFNGELTTIAERIRYQKNGAMGVVTTVPFTHATPAAFVSHNVNRNNYLEISDEIIFATRPDVVIGAGHPAFLGNYKYLSEAAYNELKTADEWQFVERVESVDGGESLLNAAALAAAHHKKLFGLYGTDAFEYPVPVNQTGAPAIAPGSMENPTLAVATEAALTVLCENENGFFLMVEQGDIDWANHANNYEWMIGAMWDLNDAVQAAVDYVEQPGDAIDWANTMIVVTSDHSNSYMRLNDENAPGAGELPAMEGADYAHTYPGNEVTYSTTGHTNELVTIYAKGGTLSEDNHSVFGLYEGAFYDDNTLIDNTQIYHAMMDFLGMGDF